MAKPSSSKSASKAKSKADAAKKSSSSSKTKPKAKSSGPTEKQLRDFVRAKAEAFLADPNITSIGIGLKNGNGPISLQFTVAQKGDSSVIESLGSTPIPKTINVFGHEVPTDVLEREYKLSYQPVAVQSLDERRLRADPIRPGISVGHPNHTGTLGLIVYDRETGAPCILSNWHVLHGGRGEIGDKTVQPGPGDDNNIAANLCGNLLRSHLGVVGDAAIARIRSREFDRAIYEIDAIPTKLGRVELGDKVVKSGRTTGKTTGVVRRIDVMTKINYGGSTGIQTIGCFEIGLLPEDEEKVVEISAGGDSGAAWLIADEPDVFVGLHFAGEGDNSLDEHALACYASSVQKKLDFLLEPPASTIIETDEPESVVARSGYDRNFLGVDVPLPGMSLSIKRDAVNFGRAQLIPYTHFSVCLSAARRLPRFVAWNVDGAQRVVLPDHGFRLDPRVDPKHQAGEELYADNPLDRAHIARRADLCWGPVAEARQANKDSFFYTNIAPQHERFNRSSRKGLWGELENHILRQAEAKGIRLSVMGGPIFKDEDQEYRGIRIPTEFWKLVAYIGTDDGLRVVAFRLSQSDLLRELEALDFDPFRIHQIAISELSTRTRLDFGAFAGVDVIVNPELAVLPQRAEALVDPGILSHEIQSELDLVL